MGPVILILGVALSSSIIAIHLILSIEMGCLLMGGSMEPCYTGYSRYIFPFIELLILSIIILISGIIIIVIEKNRLLA